MGKILYAENSYAKAIREFEKVTSADGVNKKRVAKAWLNIGLVKCMSSNHKQAHELLEKAVPYIEPDNKLLRFKYMIKKATLLKKSSWFRESYDLLKKLEEEICAYIDKFEQQETADSQKTVFQAKKFLYKALRDMARISYLLKNNQLELQYEEAAWVLY